MKNQINISSDTSRAENVAAARFASQTFAPVEGKRTYTSRLAPKQAAPRIIHYFRLFAPDAKTVQLAADFTDWQYLPLTLDRGEEGIWEISVPLAPGRYQYRFLVDGQWLDDPCCVWWEPNPFGTTNAVVEVR